MPRRLDGGSGPETRRHRFHLSCLLEWARINTLCPYCKGAFSAVIGDDGSRTDIAPVDDDDDDESESEDEDVCAACGYGGELLICDGEGEDGVGLLHVACAQMMSRGRGSAPCGRAARRARHEAHAARAGTQREPAARGAADVAAAARRGPAARRGTRGAASRRRPCRPGRAAPPLAAAAAPPRRPRPAEAAVLALARQVGDGGVSARAAEIMRRPRGPGRPCGQGARRRFIAAGRETPNARAAAPFRGAARARPAAGPARRSGACGRPAARRGARRSIAGAVCASSPVLPGPAVPPRSTRGGVRGAEFLDRG